MSENLLRDLIILASKEKQEIECQDIKELVTLRQKIYGKKKQLLKKDSMDLLGRKAANEFELKMKDSEGNPIVFNSPNYDMQAEQGLFHPCFLVLQPILNDFRDAIEKSLAHHIRDETLPSQIEARRAAAEFKAMGIESQAISQALGLPPQRGNVPDSPFDLIRKKPLDKKPG